MLKVQYCFKRPKDKQYRADVAYLNWKGIISLFWDCTAPAINLKHSIVSFQLFLAQKQKQEPNLKEFTKKK